MKDDYRGADLDPATRQLLDACVRLTRRPWEFSNGDLETLRQFGFDDEAIHDAFQIAGFFNYINRVCDGLGVELEEFMPPGPPGWVRAK